MGRITNREAQVLEMVSQGRTNREIAEGLEMAARTVKAHITSALWKTGARNRVELARWWWSGRQGSGAGELGRLDGSGRPGG